MANRILTHDRLVELLEYDQLTGLFRWKLKTSSASQSGWFGGSMSNNGYLKIRLDKVLYFAHRLAWFWIHGAWPIIHIDHRNRIRSDNRLDNLREATRSQNMRNTRMPRNNTSGVVGVSWCRTFKKWKAFIIHEKQQFCLGSFDDKELAVQARKAAQILFHGDFARQE